MDCVNVGGCFILGFAYFVEFVVIPFCFGLPAVLLYFWLKERHNE